MKKFKKLILASLGVMTMAGVLAGCTSEADTVSENLSKSADSLQSVIQTRGSYSRY